MYKSLSKAWSVLRYWLKRGYSGAIEIDGQYYRVVIWSF